MGKIITPLKRAIAERGLIQADVAQEVGISEPRLSRIVNGRVRPYDYERKSLAKALGVSREEISV